MDHIGEDTIAEFKEDEDFKEEKPKKEKKEKKEKKTTEFSNSTLHGSLQAIIIQVALLTTGEVVRENHGSFFQKGQQVFFKTAHVSAVGTWLPSPIPQTDNS